MALVKFFRRFSFTASLSNNFALVNKNIINRKPFLLWQKIQTIKCTTLTIAKCTVLQHTKFIDSATATMVITYLQNSFSSPAEALCQYRLSPHSPLSQALATTMLLPASTKLTTAGMTWHFKWVVLHAKKRLPNCLSPLLQGRLF